MIDLYVKCGDGEEGYRIYIEMEEKYGIKPSIFETTCVIPYLIRKWSIENIITLIEPFVTNTNEVSPPTYRSIEQTLWVVLLHSCSKLGDKEKSQSQRLYEV